MCDKPIGDSHLENIQDYLYEPALSDQDFHCSPNMGPRKFTANIECSDETVQAGLVQFTMQCLMCLI